MSFPGPELLSRPTDHSITVNVVADADLKVYFEYGTSSGNYTDYNSHRYTANEPIEVLLDGLTEDTRYSIVWSTVKIAVQPG